MRAKDLNKCERLAIEASALVPIFDVVYECGIPDDLDEKLDDIIEMINEIRVDALVGLKGKQI